MQPIIVSENASVTPLPPRRRAAARSNGAADIDVWPAAGGGLLVSLSLPVLRASRQMRSNLAGFFLKICPREAHALTIPYVSLKAAETDWLIEIVCDELDLPPEKIRVMDQLRAAAPAIPREFFKAEWRFRAVGSTARDMLLAEAAYTWDTEARQCMLRNGQIVHIDDERSASIGTFAAGAALQPLVRVTQLRCGRQVGLSPRRARKSDFSCFKDAWLGAVHS